MCILGGMLIECVAIAGNAVVMECCMWRTTWTQCSGLLRYTVIRFILWRKFSEKRFTENNFCACQIQRKCFNTKLILCLLGVNWNRTANALLRLLRWLAMVKRTRWSVSLEAAIEEELVCTRQAMNAANRYAITVMNQETIIRHLPRKILKLCSMFSKEAVPYTGNSIYCTVTGS